MRHSATVVVRPLHSACVVCRLTFYPAKLEPNANHSPIIKSTKNIIVVVAVVVAVVVSIVSVLQLLKTTHTALERITPRVRRNPGYTRPHGGPCCRACSSFELAPLQLLNTQ